MDIIKTSIKRPIFISMITLFAVVCGLLALNKLPVDLYPDVSYPVLSVNVSLPGAAPEEVEEILTRPIEDALAGLSGVVSMRSITREARVSVNLEFSPNTDMNDQEMQVRAKLASIRNRLPDQIDEPTVQRQDPDDTPIVEMVLIGDKAASELSSLAKYDIAEPLRQIEGVGEVSLSGERTPEITVSVKPEALESLKISIDDITTAIRNHTQNAPIGKLEGKERTWVLRSEASVKDLWSLRNLPITRTQDAASVTLGEVATVSEGFSQVRRINQFYKDGVARPAIAIEVKKQSGKNTVAVSNRVGETVASIQDKLPEGIELVITRDNAELIRTNIADVLETLVIGAILTVLVVLVFLHSPRATLTTGLSLPSSVLTTFAVMAVFDFSINVMTLLSLSLAIGLLVDDAIVVRENIFRKLQEFPQNPLKAAYEGTKQVSLAVVATTLTIVSVFLPVGMMGGTSGKFFTQFAVTVVFAILISLWDALTMAPLLSAYFANRADPKSEWEFSWIPQWTLIPKMTKGAYKILLGFEKIFLLLEVSYKKTLQWLLPRPQWSLVGIIVAGVLTVYGFKSLPKSFLPSQLGSVFSAGLNGPLGLPLDQITKTADEVNEKLKKVENLAFWSISAGTGFLGNAQINLTLRIDEEVSNRQSLAKVRQSVRQALGEFVGYTVRVSEPADPLAGSSGRFQPVAVLITGDDNFQLKYLAREVQGMMREIKGLTDMIPLNDEGIPEYLLELKPEVLAQKGVNRALMNQQLRTWVDGDTNQAITIQQEQVPIRVLMDQAKTMTLEQLLSQLVLGKGPEGPIQIPLHALFSVSAGAGPAQLTRENRQKIIRVGAGLEPQAALGDIVAMLQTKLNQYPFPKGYRARIVGQNEQMNELFSNVIVALGLGCLFMYMVLASLYESFLIPLVVMVAVPLAATGAVGALLIFGLPLDLYSGIGLVLLAGIVAKNSILLVDFAMELIRDGHSADEALLKAAPVRLRPILMTSIAMIVGMLPVATGLGAGGAARQGLGVATIGGIISSTFLTLIIVPNFLKITARFLPQNRRQLDF